MDSRSLPGASKVLGRDHPLTRAAHARRLAAEQLLVAMTLGLLAEAAGLRGVGRAHSVVLASGAIVIVLAVRFVLAWGRQTERAVEVVAAGQRDTLRETARTVARLNSAKGRRAIARDLERLLDRSLRWEETMRAGRPIGDIRHLRDLHVEICEVARQLRTGQGSIRGVALCEQLLRGGLDFALYSGRAEPVRRELGRIRYELLKGPN